MMEEFCLSPKLGYLDLNQITVGLNPEGLCEYISIL